MNDIPGQHFQLWFAAAARNMREQSGVKIVQIAALLDMSHQAVWRFERAQNWPKDPDRLAAAYAKIAGLNDPRDIYQEALDLWHAYGTAPTLDQTDDIAPGSESQQFITTILEQEGRAQPPARRRAQEKPSRGGKSTTTQTPQATRRSKHQRP